MKAKTAALTKDNVVMPEEVLTVQEFKLIRGILHTDKGARTTKAFNAFTRVFKSQAGKSRLGPR
jgi:hypothetical protein